MFLFVSDGSFNAAYMYFDTGSVYVAHFHSLLDSSLIYYSQTLRRSICRRWTCTSWSCPAPPPPPPRFDGGEKSASCPPAIGHKELTESGILEIHLPVLWSRNID